MTIVFIVVIVSQLNFIDFTNVGEFMDDFYVFKILGFVNIEILPILTVLSLFIFFLILRSFVELYKTFGGFRAFYKNIRKKRSIVFIILAILMPIISIFLLCASIINVDVQTIEKLYENKLIDEKVDSQAAQRRVCILEKVKVI